MPNMKFKILIYCNFFAFTIIALIIKPIHTIDRVTEIKPNDTTAAHHHHHIPLQFSDLEEFREQNRFIEMHNDFPKISYDTIHQILRDEDSSSSSNNNNGGGGASASSIYRRDEEIFKRHWNKTTTANIKIKNDIVPRISINEDIGRSRINSTNVTQARKKRDMNLSSDTQIILNNNDHSDSHKNLSSTNDINLNNKNLTEFNFDQLNNMNVRILNLTNNKIQIFPSSSSSSNQIDNGHNLQILDLTNNNLTEFIINDKLKSLSILNLTNNQLKKFTTIKTLNSSAQSSSSISTAYKLKELLLRNNCIKSVDFLNLTQFNELEMLDLSCNQIYELNENFMKQLKNLRKLNLSNNQLGDNKNSTNNNDENQEHVKIFNEPFYNSINIDTLILSYNNIRFIDFETFLVLPNLEYLDLSHNQIQGESIKSLQGIPDLVGLSIAYNPDLGDSLQEFVASWSLKELDASGTGLCRIPAALAQSVRTLKLTDNWLSIINCGDLDSYPLLQYLDLSNSHIDDIEDDALGRLEMLETLFLDHNNLKRLPVSLPTSLENLFLHNNQITDIQPSTLQNLYNLKILDLSGNKLLYLPGLPLPKLLTLNLQSSELKHLSQSVVKTSPKLRDLLLDDNPIKCSDLLGIAEWTSSCHEENFNDLSAAKTEQYTNRRDIKKDFQRNFDHFFNFQQNDVNLNECCCSRSSSSIATTKHHDKDSNNNQSKVSNVKNLIPTCVQLKNLQVNQIPTSTAALTTNDEKLLVTEILSTNQKQNDETFAETSTAAITKTTFTNSDKINEHGVTLIPSPVIEATITTTTTTSQQKVEQEKYSKLVSHKLTAMKPTTNFKPNSIELQQEIDKEIPIPPILSLTLNHSSDFLQKENSMISPGGGGNEDGNVVDQIEKISKHNLTKIKSDSNYVKPSVLLNQNENIMTKQQQSDEDKEKFKIKNNATEAFSIRKQKTIEMLPKQRNVTVNIKNNTREQQQKSQLNEKYFQKKNSTRKFQKIDESHIGKIFAKVNDRRLYASSKFLKDKQFQPMKTTETTIAGEIERYSLREKHNQTTLAPLPFHSKAENNQEQQQQQQNKKNKSVKLMLDKINRSEIERVTTTTTTTRKYKKNNVQGIKQTNIKIPRQRNQQHEKLTISATSWPSASLSSLSTTTIMPQIIVTTDSGAVRIKSTNSIKIQKIDKVLYKKEKNNNHLLDRPEYENGIMKRNQQLMDQTHLSQSINNDDDNHNNNNNEQVSTSKSITLEHQLSPILMHDNINGNDNVDVNENNSNNSKMTKASKDEQKNKSLLYTESEISKNSNNFKEDRNIAGIPKNLTTTTMMMMTTAEPIERHSNVINNVQGQTVIGHHNNEQNVEQQRSNEMIRILSSTINQQTENIFNEQKRKNGTQTAHHQDIPIRLTEYESLMGDNHKDEYSNDLLKNLPQSNVYHQFLIDKRDNESSNNEFTLRKKSFNEFKKDTTEFIKLEHQHSSTSAQTNHIHKVNHNDLYNTKPTLDGVENNAKIENHLKINSEISNQNSHISTDNVALTTVRIITAASATEGTTIRTTTAFGNKQIEQNHNIYNNNEHNDNNNKSDRSSSGSGNSGNILSALRETKIHVNRSHNRNFTNNHNKNNDYVNGNASGGTHSGSGSSSSSSSSSSNGLPPEQWLEIRSNNQTKIGHPGLFIVIGITFGLILFLGLVHIYRCHRKPLWYYSHNQRRHNHHHHHHHHQQQQQHNHEHCHHGNNENDYIFETNCNATCQQHNLTRCNNKTIHMSNELIGRQQNRKKLTNAINNIEMDRGAYCCQCDDDVDDNDYYIEMSDQNFVGPSVLSCSPSLSPTISATVHQNNRNILPMELLRTSRTTTSLSQIDLNDSNDNDDEYDIDKFNKHQSNCGTNEKYSRRHW